MKHDQLHPDPTAFEGDAFDQFLMQQLHQNSPYLADDDFTAGVMKALPAPKKLSRWQERLIILVPFIIISALVISQFSVLAVIIKLWILMMTMNFMQLMQLGILLSIGVISGASFWFAKQFKLL